MTSTRTMSKRAAIGTLLTPVGARPLHGKSPEALPPQLAERGVASMSASALRPFVVAERQQRRRARRLLLSTSLVALTLALGACASYAPKPLSEQARLQGSLAGLQVDRSRIALPRLAAQTIDLQAPLTLDAVATLAVLNNPQLQLARDQVGIAQAQAFAAGLLPDPQFSTTQDFPGNSAGATSSAYNYSLNFDLGSLITRPAARAAATAHVRDIDLQLLWQEWQTVGQAQLLFVQLSGLQQRDALLQSQRDLVQRGLQRTRQAVAAGNLPRTNADAALVELQAVEQRLASDAQQRLQLESRLHALLGLAPNVPLQLAPLPALPAHDTAATHEALAHITAIRPDLMALRAGYTSQEQKLREAVLAQFPSFSVGLNRARDTANVNTLGFGVSFSLPIFNGSRGAIAVQRATRQELFDAYQLRLNQTRADVAQVLANLDLLQHQRHNLETGLPQLESAERAATSALDAGAITLPQAQAQSMALLQQRLALQANNQQTTEQTVALDLLTGTGVYRPAAVTTTATLPPDTPKTTSDLRSPPR
ncbi:MAG: TolC family protein [Thiomonas sp.]